MNTEAKILIGVKNGKLMAEVQIGKLTQAEVSILFLQLDLIKDDLKERYKRGIRRL